MAGQVVDLSVIIPAYNEVRSLPATLRIFHTYLSKQSLSYEIIVVLDGCTDTTLDAVRKLETRLANLKIVERPLNRGKGFTVKEGMLLATGGIRLFADADNSTDIAHFDLMQSCFDRGDDIVIASRSPRDAAGAHQVVAQAWYKRSMGQLGNVWVQLLAVPGIWDTQCGFKAFRGAVAERIFSQITLEGWGFDIEVLALARALNYKIGIVPARWSNDARSHVRWFDYLGVLNDTLKVRFNLSARKYRL